MTQQLKLYLQAIAGVSAVHALAFTAVIYWSMNHSGMLAVPHAMAARQAADHQLLAFDGNTHFWGDLKLHRIWQEKPEVVLVGSSRGGQLRSRMLRPYTFHNASFTAWSIGQATDFLTRVTSRHVPRVVIVSLDYFMFSDVYVDAMERERTMIYGDDFKFLRLTWRKLLLSMASGTLPASGDRRLVGFDAHRLDTGYRWDGSFRYPYRASLAQRTIPYDHKAFIAAFPGGAGADARQIEALRSLAALARHKNFTLVAVQFPILKPAVDFLDHDETFKPYAGTWRAFQDAGMRAMFRELGILQFDLSRASFSDDVTNFYDSAHANETGMIRSIGKLMSDAEFAALFPRLDLQGLTNDLAHPAAEHEPLSVYGMQF